VNPAFKKHLERELNKLRDEGLYKQERVLTTSQGVEIGTDSGLKVVNFCANNYLGLCNEPRVMAAANYTFFRWGFGMASVRFICGTQQVHKDLERKMSEFLGTEDTLLYSSAFDANGCVFEPLLDEECAVISDELNHASIIDGVRLSKAQRLRYKNNDLQDLEEKLKEAAPARIRLIATDGVFSMDGFVANLRGICDLAEAYDALVMVDDSHAVGFMGEGGRGTPDYCGVMGRVDILTGTFGKALGGASGGYTAASKQIVSLLRQKSRPYLFSNTVAPAVCAATIRVLDMLAGEGGARARLMENTAWFRAALKAEGFDVPESTHPIVPVMLYDARVAAEFAQRMLEKGVYVVAFSYPVVPKGKARIRTQVSAAHTREDLEFAVRCFREVRQEMKL